MRSYCASDAHFLALTGSSAPTSKKKRDAARAHAAFSARTHALWLDFGSPGLPPGRPGHRFSLIFVPFFEVFRSDGAFARKTSDINETLAGVVQNALRSFRATSRKRQKTLRGRSRRRSATRTGSASASEHPRTVSGALPERSWAFLEHPGSSRERSWGTPNASLAVLGASRPLFEALLNRSGDAPIPQDRFWTDFGSILVRFWVDFGCSGRSLARWMARFSCPRKPQR